MSISIANSDKKLSADEVRYAQMTLIEFLDEKFPNRNGYVPDYNAFRLKEEKRRSWARFHRNLVNRYELQRRNALFRNSRRPQRAVVKAGNHKIGDAYQGKVITGFGKIWRDKSGVEVCYAYLA